MVTGGIAAYKSCYLTRLLVQAGFSVKVAMTSSAMRFVTPMTFEVLSGYPVATDLWGEDQSDALDHIAYAQWADLTVMAPATANSMAKAAQGIADDIVSTLLLAQPGPVLMAPAMNDNMWRHPATQANLELLQKRGVQIVGPGSGSLACGSVDIGRVAEPEEIFAVVQGMVLGGATEVPVFWQGQRVVITAGPTYEAIDSVRYVANRSSGAMGYALANAAIAGGAEVTLISGPSASIPPARLSQFVAVESAQEMADAVASALSEDAQWLIMSAAVADFSPAQSVTGKLKKEQLGVGWQLDMVRNPDILAEVVPGHRSESLKVVGFALETEDVHSRALRKLQAKGMDYVVANNPLSEGSGFGAQDHQVQLLSADGVLWSSESMPKTELAAHLMAQLALHQSRKKQDEAHG
ncbi:MAG: phosphopantothenoylcysteine decarboxylase/phosphopantothenate--cysteine ligase [Candidatus Krumholzibacteriia bacterium]|jgi:phosphopantothenoylcysteine decarboxylase/phosphopantothenate--cysteine ligase